MAKISKNIDISLYCSIFGWILALAKSLTQPQKDTNQIWLRA
jgi:hypothetical protein